MHAATTISTWIAFAAGCVVLVEGAAGASTARRRMPWLHRADRRYYLGLVLFGVSVLVETIPRVADASAVATLTLSLVALVPLVSALILTRSPQAIDPVESW